MTHRFAPRWTMYPDARRFRNPMEWWWILFIAGLILIVADTLAHSEHPTSGPISYIAIGLISFSISAAATTYAVYRCRFEPP